MSKLFIVVVALAAVLAVGALLFYRSTMAGDVQRARLDPESPSLYDLETLTLEGEPVALADWRGKVALAVNVASKCGLTPQYEGLEALHRELAPRGFVVLGFPSNDFRDQEPGDAAAIRDFCTRNYGVSFPLFAKRRVTGDDKDPVYALLARDLDEPSWNFTKYAVDRQGRVRARFAPATKPDDAELRAFLEDLLAEDRLRREGFFDPAPIRRRLKNHLTGRANGQYHLWGVLMFQAWLEEYGS